MRKGGRKGISGGWVGYGGQKEVIHDKERGGCKAENGAKGNLETRGGEIFKFIWGDRRE